MVTNNPKKVAIIIKVIFNFINKQNLGGSYIYKIFIVIETAYINSESTTKTSINIKTGLGYLWAAQPLKWFKSNS